MLAHGFGERGDLPLPLYMFGWGIGLALVLSFLALGTLWPDPRLAKAASGRALIPYRALSVLHLVIRGAAFFVYVACVYAAFFGFDATDRNLAPVTLYVTLWVGGQLIGGLFGDLWAAANPIDTLARLAEGLGRAVGREPGGGPTTWGHWPATVGLLIFLFYELSHPTGASPRTLAWVFGLHAVLTIVAGFLWGARWVVDHEPFTVFLAKIGAMAPLFDRRPGGIDGAAGDTGWFRYAASDGERSEERSLGLRPPMSGLATMEVKPGTVMLILVAIGGTSFDGFSESERGRELFGDLFGWSLAWAELGLMIVSIALVASLYYAGVLWIARVTSMPFEQAWGEFAPSLVPIAFGYAVAHYFQLFSDESQSFVFRLSDPFGQGWDLFGGSDALIWRIDPDIVAWVQLAAILIGHLGAVVVAHDRAVDRFPPGRSLQSQLVMLLVMVGYSAFGLWLLLTA